MKLQQRKDYAKTLYLTGNYTQKQIAGKASSTEKTISKWIKTEGWDKQRKSLLTSKKEQLVFFYNQLDAIKKAINDREEGQRHANSKEADSILKLTAAIKNLETETGVTETIEVFIGFSKWLSREDLEMAQRMSNYMDAYVQEKMD